MQIYRWKGITSLGYDFDKLITQWIMNYNIEKFYIYSFEWNKTDLYIRIDNNVIKWINLTNEDTFLNEPVKLNIYMHVYRLAIGKGTISKFKSH